MAPKAAVDIKRRLRTASLKQMLTIATHTAGGTCVLHRRVRSYGTRSPLHDHTRIIGFILKVPDGAWIR